MIEIEVIENHRGSSREILQHFPAVIGRSSDADVELSVSGVWDRHLEIDLDRSRGFLLRTCEGAWTAVNGSPCQETVLKNGDLIEIGGAKLRFWLRMASQRGFRGREISTWIAFGLIAVGQVFLIYLLPK